jgi:tetratricopeptide (TPR) repeat protein
VLTNRQDTKNTKIFLLGLMFLVGACEVNPVERNNAGNNLTVGENYEAAVQAYQISQVLNPDAPQAYYNAAIALAESENLNTAAKSLRKALETADEDLIEAAYYNLGNVYFRMGRFKEVLMRNPDDADARYNMELALAFGKLPTPTAIEQKTEPDEGETDPDITPTDQPNALTGPTPTPPRIADEPDLTATPQGGTGDFGANTPSTLVPQTEGELTEEEARQLLEDIQQDIQALSEFLRDPAPIGDPEQNDW